MLAAPQSIRVEKKVIKLFDVVETDRYIEEWFNNANEILYRGSEHNGNVRDSLQKMRTYFIASK